MIGVYSDDRHPYVVREGRRHFSLDVAYRQPVLSHSFHLIESGISPLRELLFEGEHSPREANQRQDDAEMESQPQMEFLCIFSHKLCVR